MVHLMYMGKPFLTPRSQPRSQARIRRPNHRNYIREWRNHRDLTLEKLCERLGEVHGLKITHASLSRIERGLQPYNQRQLEAIASELLTDPASLLMRNPQDPDGIWSVWDQAKPGERRQIIEIAKTLIKTAS